MWRDDFTLLNLVLALCVRRVYTAVAATLSPRTVCCLTLACQESAHTLQAGGTREQHAHKRSDRPASMSPLDGRNERGHRHNYR